MDWHASGITNDFEFELLDRYLKHVGWLDGVTGGSIAEAYRGDYRVTGTLEFDGDAPPISEYVRIWAVSTLGDETVRTCLATLAPDPPSREYRYGRWVGSVDLYSAMKRLDTCLRNKDGGLGKNKLLADYWSYIVDFNGAVPVIGGGISKTKKTTKALVFEGGEPVLSSLHVVADALSGYIEVDAYGRVVLSKYVLPSKRSASWSLGSGGGSIMLIGVDETPPELCNRVIARFEDDDGKATYAAAYASASHPWSYESTGRKEAYFMDVGERTSTASNWLATLASQELAARMAAKSVFEVTTLFDPVVRTGTVGNVFYSDSPDDPGLSFKAFCSQREIALTPSMTTTLTLEAI